MAESISYTFYIFAAADSPGNCDIFATNVLNAATAMIKISRILKRLALLMKKAPSSFIVTRAFHPSSCFVIVGPALEIVRLIAGY